MLCDAGGLTTGLPVWWTQYLRLVCTQQAPVSLVSEFWETVVDTGVFA